MQRSSITQLNQEPVPLRTGPAGPHATDLPRPMTSFLGRDRELETVRGLLIRDGARLVTLVGPGGVGKTRLAIEVARRLERDVADGVRFAKLADVRDASLVGTAISRAHASPLAGRGTDTQDPVALFREFDGLLVVDNFEHVVDAAPLMASILQGCPHLRMLATSRMALNISGEHLVTVPPLATPTVNEMADPGRIGEATAVRLFADRARARRDTFEITAGNAASIAAICDALDGLPLSIELAAAQVDILSPEALLARLHQRLPLPERGPVDAPDRHRSTRSAIAWSHDLLDANARAVFHRLAVFVGGFTLESAAAIVGSHDDILPIIGTLVDSSLLVMTDTANGEARYSMLETIREFGLECLVETGDEDATRDRHADYFHALAEWSDWSFFMAASAGEIRLARLEAEAANMRAALTWLQRRGDHSSILHMAGCLGSLWVVLGHPLEGQQWIERSLQLGIGVPKAVRARALATLSWAMHTQGDPSHALALAEESLDILRSIDKPLLTAQVLGLCSVPAFRIGAQHEYATELIEEALSILSALDGPDWVPNFSITLVCQLGRIALLRGDIEAARTCFRSAGDRETARGQEAGESHIYGSSVTLGLGDVARAMDDPAGALELYRRSLRLGWRHHNLRTVTHALGGIAGSLAASAEHQSAARFLGACEALAGALGYDFASYVLDCQRALGLPEPWLQANDSFGDFQRLREALKDQAPLPPIPNPDAASKAWAAGRRLPLEAAVAEALAVSIPKKPTDPLLGLSAREVEVLRLLVDGHTDAQIASALYISKRTAATHVRHIYDKLGVASRAGAAAWAVRSGLA